jgi:hypothetical protein
VNIIKRRLKKIADTEKYTKELMQLGELLKNNKLNDIGYLWFDTVREFGESEMDDGGWEEVEAEGLGDQSPEEMMKYYFEYIIDFDDDHRSWDWDNDHVVRFPNGQAKVIRENDNFLNFVETVAKRMSKDKLHELGFDFLK